MGYPSLAKVFSEESTGFLISIYDNLYMRLPGPAGGKIKVVCQSEGKLGEALLYGSTILIVFAFSLPISYYPYQKKA